MPLDRTRDWVINLLAAHSFIEESYLKAKNLFLLIILGTVFGCAAPRATKENASKYLSGTCLELFLNSGLGGYQLVVNRPLNNEAVFAVATREDGAQKCAAARNMLDINTHGLSQEYEGESLYAALEAIAIARCEEIGKGQPFTRCRIFARRNDIVWNKVNEPQKPSFK